MEEEFDGDRLVLLLLRPEGEALARAMIGCRYYRDDPDSLSEIILCDVKAGILTVKSPCGEQRRVALRGGYVISTDELLASAVRHCRTEADVAREEMEAVVAAFGFGGRIETDDLPVLSDTLRRLDEGYVPPRSIRFDLLRRLEKYGSDRVLEKLISRWIAASSTGSSIPGDLAIALVSVLRRSGAAEKALRVTDILGPDSAGLSRAEERILYTQRAAIWLDLHELRNDRVALLKARQCANRSWAIGASDECSLVYERLRSLERAVSDELSASKPAQRSQ